MKVKKSKTTITIKLSQAEALDIYDDLCNSDSRFPITDIFRRELYKVTRVHTEDNY